MFAPTVGGVLELEKWKDCGKGGGGLTVGKGAGRCGHRPLRDPPVTYGDIPLFKGDERLLRPIGHLLYKRRLGRTMFAPTVRPFWFGKWGKIVEKGVGGWFNGLEKGVGRCGHRPLRLGFGFADSVPGKNNPPEGGTGSLSAVRKIVSLR